MTARRRQSGVDSYEARDSTVRPATSHPIGGTPFVLIQQAPANAVAASALEFFQVPPSCSGGRAGALVRLR